MRKMIIGAFTFLAITGAFLLAYALYEPFTLSVKRYELSVPELTGLKIVFAGDFHIGPRDIRRLDKIISDINRQNPDLIILGGDYVKGHQKSSSMPIEKIAQRFAGLHAPLGVYAVLGNHDSWYGKKDVINALKKYHISVLDNENRNLKIHDHEQILTLAGVSDFLTDQPDFAKAFEGAQGNVILITHSPDIFPSSPKALLTLAAHTHGGQINLPFIGAPIVPSKYGERYRQGIILENEKTMIVTQGLGTSMLPVRFNCPPEIVVLEFQSK